MPDIEMLLRDARPHWPAPPDALEAQILGALAPAPTVFSPVGWLRRAPRSRRLRLIAVGLVLTGSGAALTSPPAIATDQTGTVSLAWAGAGRVVVSSRARSGAWSLEQPLSDRGVRANQPRLAAGARGTVAVWRERILGREVTRRFTLPDGRAAGTLTTHLDVRWRVTARRRGR